MRRTRLLAAFLLLPLAACESEPENVQTKSENLSRELERRAGEIEAEAENGVAAQVAPLDNEAEALLDRIELNGSAEANAAEAEANAQ